MDTEKHLEVQKKIEQGKSLSDEGPYYHHSWWEAYKGASKGELGGTIIGGSLGALAGITIAAMAAVVGGITAPAAIAGIVLGFSAGGIVYGVHKFSNVGAVTGAVAAAQHQAELRMDSKLHEIKQEISEIKNAVKAPSGEIDKPSAKPEKKESHLDHYRTTHYAKLEPPARNRYVFWKIALMGLAIGAAAGAILAATGATSHILEGLGLLGEHGALEGLGVGGRYLASIIPVAALGASLGINRDVFRKIFDKTDLWFKGVFDHSKLETHQISSGITVTREMEGADKHVAVATKEKGQEKTTPSPVATTVAVDGYIDYPKSSTYHRDRVLAAAEKSLLSFDHTRATPQ